MNTFHTCNPYTQKILVEYEFLSDLKVQRIVELSFLNYQKWKNESTKIRKSVLEKIRSNLILEKDSFAELMTLEMGKPISESLSEIDKSIWAIEYIAENFESWLSDELVYKDAQSSGKILKKPIGPILAIMPWNFPLWQVVRFAIPALACGNIVLLKHSEITAGVAKKIADIFNRSFPEYEILVDLKITHEQTAQLIEAKEIRAVTFTGSVQGGKAIAQKCAENLKKSVLELGGSDPYLVFPDCNLKEAVQICSKARLINNGQSCVSGKRFIVHESIKEEFIQLMKEDFRSQIIGDPLKRETQLGTLAHRKFKINLLSQLQNLKQQSVVIFDLNEGSELDSVFKPMILEMKDKKYWDQELFGPVSCVWSFKTTEEALDLANDSCFGLGSAIFSKNENNISYYLSRIESGIVGINEMAKSDPRLPFGGVKNSGYGKELSKYGLFEFLNFQSIITKN